MRALLTALLASLALAAAVTTASAFTVVNNGFSSYRIDGVDNPNLDLVRGRTYTFNVTATGHPFWIKTVQSTGTLNAYNTGVTGNGTQNGTITWTVPNNAPALLYYDCQIHLEMTGEFHITDPVPGVTPWTAGLLVFLMAGAGAVYLRRRRMA
jgi:hypothetical protein